MKFFVAHREVWIALAGILSACALLYVFNPSEHQLLPCWFYRLSGYRCPGCGLTRATHQVFHGHFSQAWMYNPLVYIVLPTIGYSFLRLSFRSFWDIHLPSLPSNKTLAYCIIIFLLLFGILRNV